MVKDSDVLHSNGFLRIKELGLPVEEIISKFKGDDRKSVEKSGEFTSNYRQGLSLNITHLPDWRGLDNQISQKVFEVVSMYNDSNESFISDDIVDTGYTIHHYRPGEIAEPHRDGGAMQVNVFLSCVFFLNTIPSGGRLVFPSHGKGFSPIADSVLLFPANFAYPHFSEAANVDRYIIVTWLKYKNFRGV